MLPRPDFLIVAVATIAGLLAPTFAPSLAFADLPANEVWREQLLNRRVGYGRNTTGGAGGTLCTVSNLNDSGAGSLRNCLSQSGPQWIIFSVSGTINVSSDRIVMNPPQGNDKTIDGRGQNITINFVHTTSGLDGFYLSGVSNWIIHNVAFTATTSDWSIRLLCADTVWIDHVSIEPPQSVANTALGIGATGGWCAPNTVPSNNITISWSRFHDNPKLGSGQILFAQGPEETTMANARLTLHHNWYQHGSDVRFPTMRYGKAHSLNNYMDNTDQGAEVVHAGQFNSENDIFDCTGPADGSQCGFSGHILRVQCTGFPEGQADNCKVTNPWLVGGTETYEQLNPGTIFNPASDYSYTLETANAALRRKLLDPTTGAGRVDNPYPAPVLSAPTNLRIVSAA